MDRREIDLEPSLQVRDGTGGRLGWCLVFPVGVGRSWNRHGNDAGLVLEERGSLQQMVRKGGVGHGQIAPRLARRSIALTAAADLELNGLGPAAIRRLDQQKCIGSEDTCLSYRPPSGSSLDGDEVEKHFGFAEAKHAIDG